MSSSQRIIRHNVNKAEWGGIARLNEVMWNKVPQIADFSVVDG